MIAAVSLPTTVLAAAAVVPGASAGPLVHTGDPPEVTGFVVSRFGPLVLDAARRCLGDPSTEDHLVAGIGERTAVVLGTVFGDSTSLDVASQQLTSGKAPDPLLCYQAVPTSVLGKLCHDYAITGPVTCVAAELDPAGELLAVADLMLVDQQLERVLLVAVELAPTARVASLRDGPGLGAPAATDAAVCLLLGRPGARPPRTPAPPAEVPAGVGPLEPLLRLCLSYDARSSGAHADP